MSADFDDLVFDPSFAQYSPGVLNGLAGLPETIRSFALHQAALASFSAVTVSTQPLAEAVASRYGQTEVLVLPNAVHWSWHSMPQAKPPVWPGRPIIGYFPGTRSHDRDFALVSESLSRVLDKHPEVVLSVTGPLTFAVKARSTQIVHHEKLSFPHFHEGFSRVSVNLAPLEATPFTRCKSAIKVIEAAFWNIPTICSPLPDAERLVDHGALLAADPEAFEGWLERLLLEPDFHARISSGLRQRVLEQANVYKLAHEWLGWVMLRQCRSVS